MLLAIDAGNTNTVIGLFDGPDEPVDHWRLTTNQNRSSDEWLLDIRDLLSLRELKLRDIDGVVIASVVPKVLTPLCRVSDRIGVKPLVVDWQTDTGMFIGIDTPSELGADRIANGVAVYALATGAAIVVDMGTATTFDVVSSDGSYVGGIILPGLDISLDALFDRAAALRRIDLSVPSEVIGTGTASAVRSGATHGLAAQIDGLCDRIEETMGPCLVVATGGLSAQVAPFSRRIDKHDPWLTLRGLRMIYERNQNEGGNRPTEEQGGNRPTEEHNA